MSNELYLCVYAREFPAQALLRLRPHLRNNAVAVMEGEQPFQQVCSLNRYARGVGVARGMSRAEMDSFPAIALLKRSVVEEAAARAVLLECAGSFSPRIEAVFEKNGRGGNGREGEFLCVLDISGMEKLFGAPMALAQRVLEAIVTTSVTCTIAVSANFHTAVCMARGMASLKRPIVVPVGGERLALAAMPLSVLDISEQHAETFAQWGVSTLGMLAMLPEKDLIGRLGQEGKRLRQLARGEYPHLLLPIEPVLALEERIELDSPVEILDSLLFGVDVMLGQLIARASARVLSLAAVTADLGLEGGSVHTRTVRPALPTSDKQLWLKLMHLDWIAHPPPAPVVSLMLRATTGETSKVQMGLFSPQLPEAGRLDITLARIRAVVGEDRVGSVELKDTHERDAFRMKPFSVVASTRDKELEPMLPIAVMRRLRPPERVRLSIRNNSPHIFYFRGTAYQAEKSYGPWRAAGGWWTDGRWSIEEWDIVARPRDREAGDLLCCCMTRDVVRDHWQMEAIYD
jgi:protein ImuB